MKSKLISLSAVSAGFIAISLTVGSYLEMADLFSLILSSVFVTLPLYLKSYKASVLAMLAGGVIAFMASGFNVMSLVFPAYIAFFGIYPIVKCFLAEKKVNKAIRIILGLIWCLAAIYGAYFYYTLVMGGVFDGLPEWISDYILIFVGIAAAVIFFIYDWFLKVMRNTSDKYLAKIIK